jgi:hypothetical protein
MEDILELKAAENKMRERIYKYSIEDGLIVSPHLHSDEIIVSLFEPRTKNNDIISSIEFNLDNDLTFIRMDEGFKHSVEYSRECLRKFLELN